MSGTRVSLLTPPAAGAIATIEVRGPHAWELAQRLFTPAGKPLPDAPETNRFWFGTCGKDEVILAVTAPDAIEVHCHGGRRVVRWVTDQFVAHNCVEERPPAASDEGAELLLRAPTLRTASIILDQLNGAFARGVRRTLALLETDPHTATHALHRLAALGSTVGRHLVEPWKVVIAGPPNVGKSSLINALAGYRRSVVSEAAGTTRDAVSVRVAFDGWPVELIDTAGIRDAGGVEAQGIEQGRRALWTADLVLWLQDATAPGPGFCPPEIGGPVSLPESCLMHVINKIDQPSGWDCSTWRDGRVSAVSGEGVQDLVARLVHRLIGHQPSEGEAVPFTKRLAELVTAAQAASDRSRHEEVATLLRESLAVAESLAAGLSALSAER